MIRATVARICQATNTAMSDADQTGTDVAISATVNTVKESGSPPPLA